MTRTRFIAALTIVALSFVPLVHAAPPTELAAAETAQLLTGLAAHRAKYPSLTANFTEEKTSHLLNQPQVNEGTLAFQAPNKFRRELKGSNPSTTVSDGRQLWIYYPRFKEAELYQLGQRAFFDDAIAALTAGLNFQQVAEFYRYKAFRDGSGYRLVLTPKSGGLKRMLRELTVWVDDDFRIQRTVANLAKGGSVATTYRNQRAAELPASTFQFTPPAGTNVSQPLGR